MLHELYARRGRMCCMCFNCCMCFLCLGMASICRASLCLAHSKTSRGLQVKDPLAMLHAREPTPCATSSSRSRSYPPYARAASHSYPPHALRPTPSQRWKRRRVALVWGAVWRARSWWCGEWCGEQQGAKAVCAPTSCQGGVCSNKQPPPATTSSPTRLHATPP